jgi:hypothetical protein
MRASIEHLFARVCELDHTDATDAAGDFQPSSRSDGMQRRGGPDYSR